MWCIPDSKIDVENRRGQSEQCNVRIWHVERPGARTGQLHEIVAHSTHVNE